jgi:hypothetical protein
MSILILFLGWLGWVWLGWVGLGWGGYAYQIKRLMAKMPQMEYQMHTKILAPRGWEHLKQGAVSSGQYYALVSCALRVDVRGSFGTVKKG